MVVRNKYVMPFEKQKDDEYIQGILYQCHTYAQREAIVYQIVRVKEDEWRQENSIYYPIVDFYTIENLNTVKQTHFNKILKTLQKSHQPENILVKYR